MTVVLAVGQLANAAAGPCGSVLNMTGLVRLSLADNVAALVLNVALNLLLIPRLGVLGAAIAWSLSLVLVNATKWLQVRRILGIRAQGTGTVATLVAALPAAALAVGLSFVLDGPAAALLVAAPAVVLVYVATLLLRGLEPDDHAMLETLRRAVDGAPGARRPTPPPPDGHRVSGVPQRRMRRSEALRAGRGRGRTAGRVLETISNRQHSGYPADSLPAGPGSFPVTAFLCAVARPRAPGPRTR